MRCDIEVHIPVIYGKFVSDTEWQWLHIHVLWKHNWMEIYTDVNTNEKPVLVNSKT